ncbi:MAG: hypothetical protein ABJE66_29830 [Deltaproteobacteria bacterium]
MQVELEHVRDQVRSAFADVAPETDIAKMRRPAFTGDDSYEMAQAFVGKKWSELAADALFYHRESLAALNANAYRAYIAAYLLAAIGSLDPLDRIGPDLRHYLVASLEPGPDAVDRVSKLSSAQRAAVVGVLRALERTWHMPEAATAAEALTARTSS